MADEDEEFSGVPIVPLILAFAFVIILAGGMTRGQDTIGQEVPEIAVNTTNTTKENTTDYGVVLENTLVNDAGELIFPSENFTTPALTVVTG